jgi:hypothetical protein
LETSHIRQTEQPSQRGEAIPPYRGTMMAARFTFAQEKDLVGLWSRRGSAQQRVDQAGNSSR